MSSPGSWCSTGWRPLNGSRSFCRTCSPCPPTRSVDHGAHATAARQLASRARHRVQAPGTTADAERTIQRTVVRAFLAASRNGDVQALVELLDPDAVIRADSVAVQAGASSEVRGAAAVAATFSGRTRAAKLVLLDGFAGGRVGSGGKAPGGVWLRDPGGQDRRDRAACRPRTAPSPRPGNGRHLTGRLHPPSCPTGRRRASAARIPLADQSESPGDDACC